MANEWMSLLPTAPVPADVAGSYLSGRDEGSRYQQQAWQNAGTQYIQKAIQQATTNGQTDWNQVATLTGGSPYAGMAQEYASKLLANRVKTAYEVATKRALMKTYGVDEAQMEQPQTPSRGDQQPSAPADVQASPAMQEQAQDAVLAQQNASIAGDASGFSTPEMVQEAQQAQNASGYDVGETQASQVGGTGISGSSFDMSPTGQFNAGGTGLQQGTVDAANATPKNWLGNISTSESDPFYMLNTLGEDGGIRQVSPDDVNAMGKDSRAERVRALQASGLLAGNVDAGKYDADTNQAIATAINADSRNRVLGLFGKAFQGAPEEIAGNLLGATLATPGAVASTQAQEGEAGRGVQSGRLGVKSGQVGLEASRTGLARSRIGLAEDTNQYDNIQQARAAGYGTVSTAADLAQLQAMTGNAAALQGAVEGSTELLKNPKALNNMDARLFQGHVTRFLNPLLTNEGVVGVGATELFDQNFRPKKDAAQILQQHGLNPAAATSLVKQFGAPTRSVLLSNLRTLARESLKNGVNAQKLKNMRQPAINWANQPVQGSAPRAATAEDF